MKIISLFFVACLFAVSPAFADQWCQWNGTAGINCQDDSRGFIIINDFPVRTPAIANARGWYKLVITEPTVGTNQIKGSEIWSFAASTIGKTWAVRNLTTAEIDEQTAQAMPLSEYWLWKALLGKGVITQQEAVALLPQEVIDAYLARERLEE